MEALGVISQRSPGRVKQNAKSLRCVTPSFRTRWERVSQPVGGLCSVSIGLVERLGNRTITVNWRDATACCYSDQRWIASVARAAGVCALSGMVISKGDAVFRPQSGRLPPTNARAMMLTRVVDAVLPAPGNGFTQLVPL
jgi:hypothetical protein